MDSKLLLVKAISLLYRESQLPNQADNSAELVNEVLTTIRNPDFVVDTDFGREVISSLKKTVGWMMDQPTDEQFDKTDLLQRIRVNVGDDEFLYNAVKDGIDPELEHDDVLRSCTRYREDLRTYLLRLNIKKELREASNMVNFQEESIDWRHFVPDLMDRLEPLAEATKGENKTPGVVDSVRLSDVSAVEGLIRRGQESLSTEGVLRFGWQGLNRMFGKAGGQRRGEFLVVSALQHNFKSGMTIKMHKHAALYNKPYMHNADKTPLLLRLSFENDAANDIMEMYQSLVENDIQKPIDITTVDVNEAAMYVGERLGSMGYENEFKRIDPSDFTYHDLFDLLSTYEAAGYEIHGVWADYLNMMSKRGCNQGPAGTDVRDLYRRTRNFTSRRGIAFTTPHQLSTEAKMLLRMGGDNFVQEIANKGYYDSCKTIDQEVDMEITQHIVTLNGEKYLTLQRGKHRGMLTPERDQYCVLKFNEWGTIPDDINGRDTSRRQIGGGTMADGGAAPWF